MDRELWTRITDIFDAALDCPAAERQAYVARACHGDPALFARVTGLLDEFEHAGSFLEEPLSTPVRALEVGALLAGRYRIEALLGRGGMGEVYRAHDEFVGEALALKTLRPDLAVNAELVRRLRREVQLSRRVTHPNVCRVFDVGIHADGTGRPIHFYTMELLDGQPLSARIRAGGPLAGDEAYRLAVQLADGLQAAHTADIVHRDFKSGNVMLCDRGAVITDFGLARVALTAPGDTAGGDTVRTISVTAQVAGTVGYMSPEQLAGEPVTSATDIYSFGIVLFEMTTGRLPFNDTHIIQAAMQRAGAAPDVRALAPSLRPAWAAALTRCLQRDPARRFPDAPSVVRQLGPAWRPAMAYWTRREWTRAAAAGALATAGLAAIPAYLRFSSEEVVVLPEGAQVLLGTILNATGDEQFDGATELLRNQLAQSVRLNLIDVPSVASMLQQMQRPDDTSDPAAIREAAWRLNASLSIFGTLSRLGADYALSVQLEFRGSQPDAPAAKPVRSFSAANPAGLMRSVHDASRWIRDAVGESAETITSFDRMPENATTPSWEALTFYARGQQHFMKNDMYAALDQFEHALRQDPDFTLVRMRKADLLSTQYKHAEAIDEWQQAIDLLSRRPVTRAEELYGHGMFALDGGDLETADLHFRTWSREYPNDWRGSFYRMMPLCMSGHAANSLELLQAQQQRMPDYGDLYIQMINCHLVLGQRDQVRALLPAATRLNRPERARLREAYLPYLAGDAVGYLEALRAIVRDVLAQPADRRYLRAAIDATRQEGLLLIDADLPEAAAARLSSFLTIVDSKDLTPQLSVLRLVQAWAALKAGQSGDAIEQAARAMDEEPGPVKVALAGTIFARLGERALVARALEQCGGTRADIVLYRQARHRIQGEAAAAAGRRDEAIRELRLAADLEPPLAHKQFLIEALPDGDPARLALCRNVVQHPWQFLRPPPLHCIGSLRLAVPAVLAAGDTTPFAAGFAESSRKLAAIA